MERLDEPTNRRTNSESNESAGETLQAIAVVRQWIIRLTQPVSSLLSLAIALAFQDQSRQAAGKVRCERTPRSRERGSWFLVECAPERIENLPTIKSAIGLASIFQHRCWKPSRRSCKVVVLLSIAILVAFPLKLVRMELWSLRNLETRSLYRRYEIRSNGSSERPHARRPSRNWARGQIPRELSSYSAHSRNTARSLSTDSVEFPRSRCACQACADALPYALNFIQSDGWRTADSPLLFSAKHPGLSN